MITENELVVVDFNATWCPPCRGQEKEFGKNGKNLFVEYPNLKLCSMNVDKDGGISDKLGIKYVPTILIYYKGIYQRLDSHGYPVDKILEFIKKFIEETDQNIANDPSFLGVKKTEQTFTL